MRNHIAAALVLGSAALFSAGAHAQAVKTQDGILVNSAGMTLYTFCLLYTSPSPRDS